MSKKRILFIIPSLVGGGAERSLLNLLNFIDYTTYFIDLAVVSYKGVYINSVPEDVNVIPLFKNDFLVRFLSVLQKKIGFIFPFKYVVNKKLTGNYDKSICYVDGNFTDLLNMMSSPGIKLTWVHSSYQSYSNFAKYYKNDNYKKKIINTRYKMLDGIIFVSQDCKDEFINIFGKYDFMPVVYNIIDENNLYKKAKEFYPEESDGRIEFVAVGSLYPVKGYYNLIMASKKLLNHGYDFKVRILGDGYLKSKLIKKVKELELTNNVMFMGFKRNPYPYIKNADIFIMTSFSEALPVSLMEAILLEKPVLVTNCSGCRELVHNGHYGLMAEQNIDSIYQKMKFYLDNPLEIDNYREKSKQKSKDIKDCITVSKNIEILNRGLNSESASN